MSIRSWEIISVVSTLRTARCRPSSRASQAFVMYPFTALSCRIQESYSTLSQLRSFVCAPLTMHRKEHRFSVGKAIIGQHAESDYVFICYFSNPLGFQP